MKFLLINHPAVERAEIDQIRFSSMVRSLNKAGIDAEYQPTNTLQELKQVLASVKPDLVYSADLTLPDTGSGETCIHEYFEETGVPYVGADKYALKRVLSKSEIKETWKFHHISTPPFCRLLSNAASERVLDGFFRESNFPYILKPDKEGNSRGLDETSIVFDRTALLAKINELLAVYDTVLVEEYLGGHADLREFTVAMIGSEGHRLLMPAEILLKEKKIHRIITTDDKDLHRTLAVPVTDPVLRDQINLFAEKTFSAAGMVDYSRCDILMTAGEFYAIEINGLPMIPDKWFEVCAGGAGLNADQYLIAIVMAAVLRHIQAGNSSLHLTPQMLRSLPEKVWHVLCEGSSPCQELITNNAHLLQQS